MNNVNLKDISGEVRSMYELMISGLAARLGVVTRLVISCIVFSTR